MPLCFCFRRREVSQLLESRRDPRSSLPWRTLRATCDVRDRNCSACIAVRLLRFRLAELSAPKPSLPARLPRKEKSESISTTLTLASPRSPVALIPPKQTSSHDSAGLQTTTPAPQLPPNPETPARSYPAPNEPQSPAAS